MAVSTPSNGIGLVISRSTTVMMNTMAATRNNTSAPST